MDDRPDTPPERPTVHHAPGRIRLRAVFPASTVGVLERLAVAREGDAP